LNQVHEYRYMGIISTIAIKRESDSVNLIL